MNAPDFIAQNGDLPDGEQAVAWQKTRMRAFEHAGARFFRVTKHDTIPNLFLLEGWYSEPEILPAPHFQIQAGCQNE